MKKSNYGMSTLHMLAKMDSPIKYLDSQQKIYHVTLKDAIEIFYPYNVANVAAVKYAHRFKCACTRRSIWYEFVNHRWVKLNSTYKIRKMIFDEILMDLKKYQEKLSIKIKLSGTNNVRNYHANMMTKIIDITKKLNDFTYQIKVIRELASHDKIFDPFFIDKLNENPYIICFNNGIFDFTRKLFRDGCPDDYVSLSTGYDFIGTTKDNLPVNELLEYLNGYNFDDIDELLTIMNDSVIGFTQIPKLNILCGKHFQNHKIRLMQFIKYFLGDYFEQINNAFLLSGNINYLKCAKGKRLCYIEELDSKIKTNAIANLVHGMIDKPVFDYTANLDKNIQLEFKPYFTFMAMCETTPIIENIEPNNLSITNIINFEKLVDDSNLNLDQKFTEWASILMSVFISNHIEN